MKSFSEMTKTEKSQMAKKAIILSILLFAIVTVLFGLLLFFGIRKRDYALELMRTDLVKEMSDFDDSISECAELVQNAIAEEDYEVFTSEEKRDVFLDEYESNSELIRRIGIINKDGICAFSKEEQADISFTDVYKNLMDGETLLRGSLAFGSKKFIYPMIFIPVYDGSEVIGGLVGLLKSGLLTEGGETVIRGESTATLITDRNLDVLFRYSDGGYLDKINDLEISAKNFKIYHLKEPDDLIEAVKSDSHEFFLLRYKSEKKEFVSYYDAEYDVYMMRFVPHEYIHSAVNYFSWVYLIEVLLCIISLCGVSFGVLYILGLFKRQSETMQLMETLDTEFDSMTVEYDFDTSKLILTGCADKLFGIERKRYEWVRPVELFDKLHAEDAGARKSLNTAIDNKEDKFTCEFRAENGEGKYDWCKLMCVIMREPDGHTRKLYGNVRRTEGDIEITRNFKRQSEEDLLTGILNKITIEKETDRILSENPNGIYVFFISDLDNFKSVNDHFGHAKGDDVIRDTAQKLEKVFSINDLVGRIGGDEFAVVMSVPESMRDRVDALIDMKVRAISKSLARTYKNESTTVNVTASIGIYIHKDVNESFADMYKKADKALYHSKENGKNTATIYSEESR